MICRYHAIIKVLSNGSFSDVGSYLSLRHFLTFESLPLSGERKVPLLCNTSYLWCTQWHGPNGNSSEASKNSTADQHHVHKWQHFQQEIVSYSSQGPFWKHSACFVSSLLPFSVLLVFFLEDASKPMKLLLDKHIK